MGGGGVAAVAAEGVAGAVGPHQYGVGWRVGCEGVCQGLGRCNNKTLQMKMWFLQCYLAAKEAHHVVIVKEADVPVWLQWQMFC